MWRQVINYSNYIKSYCVLFEWRINSVMPVSEGVDRGEDLIEFALQTETMLPKMKEVKLHVYLMFIDSYVAL